VTLVTPLKRITPTARIGLNSRDDSKHTEAMVGPGAHSKTGTMPLTNPSAGGLCKRVKQVSYRKQRETKDSTPEIEIVTDAVLRPPMHPGKQV